MVESSLRLHSWFIWPRDWHYRKVDATNRMGLTILNHLPRRKISPPHFSELTYHNAENSFCVLRGRHMVMVIS